MNPMRYYEAHEAEYKRRLAAGHSGWDPGDYDGFFMRAFVERSLARSALCRPGARALDLGCGTGALSCLLAGQGFDVLGIDVSGTAIAAAREMAAARELNATFQVTDLCDWSWPRDAFDLIVDSHVLHCIVFEKERRKLLENVAASLTAAGEFWIETMVLAADQLPNPAWHLDETGIVWSRCEAPDQYADAVNRGGTWWLPQRFIARSAESLRNEIHSVRLHVVEWEEYAPLESGCPGGVRARCKRA